MKIKTPESHATHPNVVPMIDVIMCLIVFYMLVARIGVNTGEDEKIQIPFARLGQQIKSMDNTLLVNVKEENNAPVVSAMLDPVGGKREMLTLAGGPSNRRLADVLKRFRYGDDLKEGGAGRFADNPEFKLIIRGDKDLTFGVLQQVLLEAAQAKVKSLNFQASTRTGA